MADEEISSLLLRVGVDFAALEEFTSAMPEVVQVAEAVGAALNELPIGSPEIFRAKGEALSRALAAGIQAGALGLQFGGGNSLASLITERVFGQLDPQTATGYVRDVQRVLDNVNLQLPQLTDPGNARQAFASITQGAGGAQAAVTSLTSQLATLRGELAALQGLTLPKTLVRRQGDSVEIAPAARKALESVGIRPPAIEGVRPSTGSGRTNPINVTETNRRAPQYIQYAVEQRERELQRQLNNTQRVIEGVQAPTRANVLDELTQLLSGPVKRVESATDRLARAAEEQARAAERAAELERRNADRIAGTVTGAGGAAADARSQLVPTREVLRFASADLLGAQADPLLPAIIESVRQRGIRQPVRIETDAEGNARLGDGHHRLLAAQALNLRAVPVTIVDSGISRFEGHSVPLEALRGARLAGEIASPSQVGLPTVTAFNGRLALPVGNGLGSVTAEQEARQERLQQRALERAYRQADLLDREGRVAELAAGPAGFPTVIPALRRPIAPPFNIERLSEPELRALAELATGALPGPIRGGGKIYAPPSADVAAKQRNFDGSQTSIQRMREKEQSRDTSREAQRAAVQAQMEFDRLPLADQAASILRGRQQDARLMQQAQETQARYEAQQAARAQRASLQRLKESVRSSSPLDLDERIARRDLLRTPRPAPPLPDYARAAEVLENLGRPTARPVPPPLTRGPAPDPMVVLANRLRAGGASEEDIQAVVARASGRQRVADLDARLPAGELTGQRRLVEQQRAQGAAQATYLANVVASRQLDEALARLQVALEATARASLTAASSLVGGAGRFGVSSLIGGPLQVGTGVGRTLDPRLQDAQLALEAANPRPPQSPFASLVPQLGPVFGPPLPPRGAPSLPPPLPPSSPALGAGGAGAGAGGGGGRGAGFPPPPFPEPGPLGRGGPVGPPAGDSLFTRLRRGAREGLLGKEEGDSAEFLARSAASALRFSVVYGAAYSALRLFTNGFHEGVQGAIEYETALTNLNIATERTGRSNDAFAASLVNLGAGRGFGPGESVEAGARAVGLFGATDSPRAQQESIARTSVDVASKIAFISGQTLEQVQTQLAGITRSFNVDPADQSRIFDVASYVGRRSGRPAGELLQSLGQIGSLGGDAGFTLEQTSAIIARLTSTTGQTPQAVSGFLSQILSRADDPRLQARLRGVGVDTQGTTLAQQIQQLSGLDLPQSVKNQIVSGFGRGRSGQALGIVLDQFPEIQKLAQGAENSAGLGDKDFAQASNTVGAQLRILGSSLKDLATSFINTGILDVFVLLLQASQGLVTVLDGLIDIFNLIPREARSTGIALLEVYAALSLLGRLGGVAKAVAAANGVTTITSLGAQRAGAGAVGSLALGRLAGFASASSSAVGGLLGGGALLGGAVLGGVAAAGLGAFGAYDAIRQNAAVNARLRTAGIAVSSASDEEGIANARRRVALARRAAEERDDFKLLSKDSLTFGIANIVDDIRGGSKDQKRQADEDKARLDEREKAVAAATAAAVDKSPGAVFDGFAAGTESVTKGLENLKAQGFTATDQLAALNQAFDVLILKSGQGADAIGVILPGQFEKFRLAAQDAVLNAGGTYATDLGSRNASRGFFRETLLQQNPLFAIASQPSLSDAFNEFNPFKQNRRERREGRRRGADEIQRVLADPDTQRALSDDIQSYLVGVGKDPALGVVTITEADKAAIAARRKAILEKRVGKPFKDLDEQTKNAFYDKLDEDFANSVAGFNGGKVTPESAQAVLEGLQQTAPAAGQETALATGDAIQGAQRTLDAYRSRRPDFVNGGASPETIRSLDLLIAASAQEVVKTQEQRVDSVVKLLQAQSGDDPVTNALLDIQGIQQKLAMNLTKDERLGLEAQLAQTGLTLRRGQAANASSRELAGIDPRNSEAVAAARVDGARRQLAVAIPGSQAYYEAISGLRDAQKAYADTVTEGQVALLYRGIKGGDTLARDKADLQAINLRERARQRGLPAATALNDFDTAGNAAGQIDLATKGQGIGSQVIAGLLKNNFLGTGTTVGQQIVQGLGGAVASFLGTLGTAAADPGGGTPGQPGYTPARSATQVSFANASAAAGAATTRRQAAESRLNKLYDTGKPAQIAAAERDLAAAKAQEQSANAALAQAAAAARAPSTTGVPGSLAAVQGTDTRSFIKSLEATSGISGIVVTPHGENTGHHAANSYHYKNEAIDFGAAGNDPVKLSALAQFLSANYGGSLTELIYRDPRNKQAFGIKNGKAFDYGDKTFSGHEDHVHVAIDPKAAAALAKSGTGVGGVDPALLAALTGATGNTETPQEQAVFAQQREENRIKTIQDAQDRDVAKLQATLDPRDSLQAAGANVQIARRKLRDAAAVGGVGSAGFYRALAELNQAKEAYAQAERDRASSADTALAAGRGPLVEAQTRLHVAQRALAGTKKNTKEYFDALTAVREAQVSLADTTRDAAVNALRANSDLTDPVAQAGITLRGALRKQREDKARGADAFTQNQDAVDVKNAQNAVEAATFDEGLYRARTDAALGLSSQSAYLAYLKGQEARLKAIKHRTVQEDKELDTVLQAEKDLNTQLQGQFNIGDIDVPTPFETRRQIKEGQAGLGQAAVSQQGAAASFGSVGSLLTGSAGNQYVTIQVNGGDLNQVKQVMAQYLGASAFQRTSISYSKV